MTVRDVINKQKRKAGIMVCVSFVFCMVCILTSKEGPSIIPLLGVAIFTGSYLFMLFGIRCPRCRGNIGYFTYPAEPFNISQTIKFCPFCGVALDLQLDEIQKA